MRLLYLHGFASGPSSSKARFFAEQFAALGENLEVLDLAEGDFERLTITRQLALVERIAGKDPVRLIGSSMGGYLAALHASRNPAVDRLVLLAPAFCIGNRWPEALGDASLDEWRDSGWRNFYHYQDQCQRRLHYGLIEDVRAYPDFPDFEQPALIIHGTRDDVVPARLSEEFAAVKPNVRLLLVESGHELTDVLDLIWSSTREFLSSEPHEGCLRRS